MAGTRPADEVPAVAVRATASTRLSTWSRRPVRVVRHDALGADGSVVLDVDPARALGHPHPADLSVVLGTLALTTPRDGRGPWVHASGGVMTGGPDGPDPGSPAPGTGRRTAWRDPVEPRTTRRRTSSLLLVAGVLLATVAVVVLTTRPTQPTGVLGVLAAYLAVVSFRALWARRRTNDQRRR